MAKRSMAVLLVFVVLTGLFPWLGDVTDISAAGGLANGTVIYYEDFNYANTTGNSKVLSTLGWTLAEEFRSNSVTYSIDGGKLLCDTTGSTSTSDSYVTVLDDAAMSEVAKSDYTIAYKLKYVAATDYTKYSCLIYNYNGYKSYNTVHLRVAGYGNNQVRAYSWYSYDDSTGSYYMPATGNSSISYKLFGVPAASANASANTDYPMVGKEVTIRIAVDIDKGPTVYINGTKVSVPVAKYKELFMAAQQYASAIALKTTAKIKAYMDDFIVYTGLGDIPTGVTKESVSYQPPKAPDNGNTMKVMTFNTLYENQATAALSDGLNRTTHMYNVVAGFHPDIVGFQERSAANKSGITSLLASNAGYAIVDEYRTDTTVANVVTMVPIMYNTKRFTLESNSAANNNVGHGALLFDKSYNIKGMTAAQKAAYSGTKGLAWAVLKDKVGGGYVLALNAHFALNLDTYTDYTAEEALEARLSNATQALDTIKKVYAVYGTIPTVFTGDFNMRSNDASYKLILTKLADTIYANDGFIRYEYSMGNISSAAFARAPNLPIDHIFYSSEALTPLTYEVGNGAPELRIASDHLPVVATYTINKAVAPLASHSTGIYNAPQSVTLNGDGEIYYTTDSSDPRNSDTRKLYPGVISVTKDTVIKYCARVNGVYSNVERITLFFGNPLYITEVIKNSPGTDMYEGVEIINVSSVPLDLYDFILWNYSNADEAACKSVAASAVSSQMKMARVEGQAIVPAGSIAYCPMIYSASYTDTDKISSTESVRFVTLNEDATQVTYHTDRIAKAIAYDKSGSIAADLIFPIDRTARSIGYTEDGTLVKRFDYYHSTDGDVNNLTAGFNLSNSTYTKLYISFNTAQTVSEAVCSCFLDSTDGGTTTAEDGTTSVATGAYNFTPTSKALMATASFTASAYTIGGLTADQQAAFNLLIDTRWGEADTAISTAEEFAVMSPGGRYYLTADITLNTSYASKFTGVFDGNGYTVTTSAPMFADISGTVKNLKVKGEINGKGTYNGAIGIKSTADARFENVVTNVHLYGGTTTGGLVGFTADGAKIAAINCSNYGNVSGSIAGGLFGEVEGPSLVIDGCVNKGKVQGDSYAGGIIARYGVKTATVSYICNVTNTANYGEVTGGGSRAAGILGYSVGCARVSGCTNHGYVHYSTASTNFIAGGIYGSGSVSYVDSTGATINTVNALYITDCYNHGKVEATTNAGGIAGRLSTNGAASGYNYKITACGNTGSITTADAGSTYGTKGAGGIAGYFMGGSTGNGIFHCYNVGTITVNGGTNGVVQRACGLVAYFSGAKTYVKDCYNAGNVVGNGTNTVVYQLFYNNNATGGNTSYISNNYALAVSGASYAVNGTQADAHSTFTAAQLSGGTVKTNLNKGAGKTYYYQSASASYPVLKEYNNNLKNGIVLKDEAVYTEDGSYVYKVPANTALNSFKNSFLTKVKVFRDGSEEAETSLVSTGWLVSSYDGTREMTVAVTGDTDGTGTVSATDYINLKSYIKSDVGFSKAQLLAADMDDSGDISAADYVTLKLMLSGN